jgi:branched-chain amino acid transport system permease protein
LTVSWAIFSGPTGYISLAPAVFFGVGIYTSALLGQQINLPLVIFTAGVISFVIAVLTGALTLRLKGVYFTIFTFGLLELIKQVLLWYEVKFTGTRGRFVIVVDNTTIYYWILGILVVLMIVAYLIRRSKWGKALEAIGDNEEAAAHIGINTTLLKVVTFAIGAFFTGAAGAIIAARWTYIDPYIAFNYFYSFLPVLMAIFGGVGHIMGPVIGSAIFAFLEEKLITEFPYYYMLMFGIILLLSILYMPKGIIGIVQKLWQRSPGRQHAST